MPLDPRALDLFSIQRAVTKGPPVAQTFSAPRPKTPAVVSDVRGCWTRKSFRCVRACVRAAWLPSGTGSQKLRAALFPFPFWSWGTFPFPFWSWGAFPFPWGGGWTKGGSSGPTSSSKMLYRIVSKSSNISNMVPTYLKRIQKRAYLKHI